MGTLHQLEDLRKNRAIAVDLWPAFEKILEGIQEYDTLIERLPPELRGKVPPISLQVGQPVATFAWASSGDWRAVYVGDKLMDQGDSVNVRSLLEAMGFEIVDLPETDLEAHDRADFPESLEELRALDPRS